MGWSTPRTPEELPFPTRKIVDREIKDNLDYLKTTVDTKGVGDILADGTVPFTGTLDMGTNKIENVVDPTTDQEAATKKYVDDNAGALSASWSQPARSKNTNYQNGANVRIVTIAFYNDTDSSACALYVEENDSTPDVEVCVYSKDTADLQIGNFTAVIPPSWYYKLGEITSTITVYKWTEVDLT